MQDHYMALDREDVPSLNTIKRWECNLLKYGDPNDKRGKYSRDQAQLSKVDDSTNIEEVRRLTFNGTKPTSAR